ncbi:hypothetical protein [Anoxybacillus sp. MB8]|nr:hypothetical protein [Anoxybacillus sp. MB8]
MLQIKRLSECTLEEAVRAWNAGFKYGCKSGWDKNKLLGLYQQLIFV